MIYKAFKTPLRRRVTQCNKKGDSVHPCHHKLHEGESKGEERSQGEECEGKRRQQ